MSETQLTSAEDEHPAQAKRGFFDLPSTIACTIYILAVFAVILACWPR
jgi:hypothetical protein